MFFSSPPSQPFSSLDEGLSKVIKFKLKNYYTVQAKIIVLLHAVSDVGAGHARRSGGPHCQPGKQRHPGLPGMDQEGSCE